MVRQSDETTALGIFDDYLKKSPNLRPSKTLFIKLKHLKLNDVL